MPRERSEIVTLFEEIPFKKEFLRAVSGSSGIHLFGTVMAFLVGIQLARGLGLAGYGLYGSAVAAAGLGATIASGGIQIHATRGIASYRALGDGGGATRLLVWSARTAPLNCLAAALCVGAYVVWGQGATLPVAFMTMALTVSTALMALTGAVVRGAGALVLGQALTIAIRPTVQSGLLFVAILGLSDFTHTTALAIACISALVSITAGFGVLLEVWRGGVPQAFPVADERSAWRRSSGVMGLTTIVRAAEAALPLLFIGALSSMEQAGLYRVASSAMVVTNMAETMITIMVPAMTVRIYEDGNIDRLKKLSAASCVVMVVPTISIALLVWSFGGPLLGFAFGTDFAPASMALTVLTTGAVVSALGGISIALLHASRKEVVVTRAFALSLTVSAGGSLLLAPQYGASGVAVAVLAGVVLRTAWLAYACRRLVGLDPTFLGAIKTFVRKLP